MMQTTVMTDINCPRSSVQRSANGEWHAEITGIMIPLMENAVAASRAKRLEVGGAEMAAMP
jgi:uncharacterized protein YfaP (DUF2135 family)